MESRGLVAWNLRKFRLAKRLSQEKLALEAGIARTYVSRLERGVENPTVVMLDRLAKALSVKSVDFLAPKVTGGSCRRRYLRAVSRHPGAGEPIDTEA
ncbi:MAG: helix-turn-helix transcriptional regulator [Rhizobiales bacterium]|nr:helix-turn-helix transcriptional regulator [Hyphomicrobiales bacterium]